MDFSPVDDTYGALPILQNSPFPDLDSPWKSGHNPFYSFSSSFLSQAIQPAQLENKLWASTSSISERTSPASTISSSSTLQNGGAGSSITTTTTEYRPRGPTGKRKGSTRRITPKSKKHAHELSRNRTAATKYRNRQKTYVDGLQQKCKDAEVKRERTLSEVQSLRDELFDLRRELLRHTNCGDFKARDHGWSRSASL